MTHRPEGSAEAANRARRDETQRGIRDAHVRYPAGYHRSGDDPPPPPEHVTYLLNRSFTAFEALKAQWRRGLSLNTHERMAISNLWEAGPLTMGDLGDRLALSRAAMTALVDRLEEAHYVERVADVMDRRRTILKLCPVVQQQMIPLAEPFHRALAERMEQLDEREWHAVVGFLDTLYELSQTQSARFMELEDEEVRNLIVDFEHDLTDRGQ